MKAVLDAEKRRLPKGVAETWQRPVLRDERFDVLHRAPTGELLADVQPVVIKLKPR